MKLGIRKVSPINSVSVVIQSHQKVRVSEKASEICCRANEILNLEFTCSLACVELGIIDSNRLSR